MKVMWNGRTVCYRPNRFVALKQRRKQSVVPLFSTLLAALAILAPASPLVAQEESAAPPQAELTWREAWRGVDEAMRLFEAGEFEKAAQLFGLVREQAPEGEMDLDALRLMEGTAHWNAGNPDAARRALEGYQDLEEDLPKVQKRQVLGSANLALAEQQLANQQSAMNPEVLKNARERAEEAKTAFESALQIQPDSDETLTQLEKTLQVLKQIKELEQQQKQDQQQDQEQEDQEEQEQEEQDQQQQDQEQEDPQDQKQSSPQNQDPSEQQEQEDEQDSQEESSEQDSASQEEQEQEDQQDADAEPQEPSDSGSPEEENQSADANPPEEMQELSEQQAQQLLQTFDEQERRQRRQFLQQRVQSIPVEKDW